MKNAEIYIEQTAIMMRPAVEVLRIARTLLSDRLVWTQGARARDADGNNIPPHHPSACCWNMNGALSIASNPAGVCPPDLLRFLDSIVAEWGFEVEDTNTGTVSVGNACEFEDEHGHAAMLSLLDEAIRRLS